MIDPDDEIARLAADWIGLDAESVGRPTIERARRRRQTTIGVLAPSAYLERVRHDPAERDALIEELVVHDSWFFREPAAFGWLTAFARRLASTTPTTQPLRFLSIPSARGEEPYSMAAALNEAGLPASRVSIDAYDVSLPAIDEARTGEYTAASLRGASSDVKRRLFTTSGKGWRLKDELRSLVRFAQGNVLHPQLPGGRPPYDVIFCRNLIIYLREDARSLALANFARWLAPGGRLVLGSSESLGTGPSPFSPTNEASFVYALSAAASVAPPRSVAPVPLAVPPRFDAKASSAARWRSEPLHARTPRFDFPAPASKAESPRPEPPRAPPASASAASEPSPAKSSGRGCVSRPLLDAAAEAANRRDYAAAVARCEEALRQGPSPEAYFLMGSIRLAAGEAEQAETALSRAVYLDPYHADALLSLALLAEQRGAQAAAEAFRRRAAQAHSGGPR